MSLKYLALGDSYTIGEAVSPNESFPYQLATCLNEKGIVTAEPIVIAQTGWTTDELKAAIDATALKSDFDLVTLLVGVNNQYRGYALSDYRQEFKELLQMAIGFAAGIKAHVFVLSIPDWGATTFGQASGRNLEAIATEIDAFNVVNREETLALGIAYIDITPGSRTAREDSELLANDGLHYSSKLYQQWVEGLLSSIQASSKEYW